MGNMRLQAAQASLVEALLAACDVVFRRKAAGSIDGVARNIARALDRYRELRPARENTLAFSRAGVDLDGTVIDPGDRARLSRDVGRLLRECTVIFRDPGEGGIAMFFGRLADELRSPALGVDLDGVPGIRLGPPRLDPALDGKFEETLDEEVDESQFESTGVHDLEKPAWLRNAFVRFDEELEIPEAPPESKRSAEPVFELTRPPQSSVAPKAQDAKGKTTSDDEFDAMFDQLLGKTEEGKPNGTQPSDGTKRTRAGGGVARKDSDDQ